MKRTILFLIFTVVAVFYLGAAPAEPQDTRVVASVLNITKRQAPLSKGINITFMIHNPQHLCGTIITLVGTPESRKDVRARFPIGGLQVLALPPATIAALQQQQKNLEQIQRQLDVGVRPEMISQLIIPPDVAVATLKSTPAPFVIPK